MGNNSKGIAMTSIRSFVRRTAAIAAAMGLLAAAGCASGPSPEEDGRLYFMVGCWRSADGANQETWASPVGGLMFGHAETFRDGQLSFFEQSRIDLRTQPASYTVSPNGSRAVTFVEDPEAALPDVPSVTFQNAENDFPQKIAYRREKNGLAATISMLDGSRPVEYAWERC
jgi:hypothetical protein